MDREEKELLNKIENKKIKKRLAKLSFYTKLEDGRDININSLEHNDLHF